MRLILVTPIGIVIALLVFWAMQWMISPSVEKKNRGDEVAMVDFIRALKDSSSESKQRNAKEPPKPKMPPVLETPQLQQAASQKLELTMPNINSSLSSFKGDAMGSMLSGYGVGDSDVIPLVEVQPRYPAQAKSRKIEGYVVVRLAISKEGSVEDVEVIDAKPKGIFEREVMRAAYRYRFKPKLADGKPVAQQATKTFEFSLEK